MGNIVFVIYRPARQVLAAGMRTVVTGGGGGGGAVDSVNGQTGVVVLDAADVGADAAGTAAAAVAAHTALSDPHPQYLTPAEGNAAYERVLTAGTNVTIDRTNPSAPVINVSGGGGGGAVDSVNGQTGVVVLDAADVGADVAGAATAAVAAHTAASDPHTQYLTPAEASSAYAPLAHVGSGGAAHANAIAAGAAGFMTGADKTKLDGVAAGATQNSADATLLARANHTGTQTASTISDFASASRAQTEAELVAGTNVTITPSGSGATRQLTIAAAGGGGSTNLSTTTSTTTLTVNSDTGTDAVLPAATPSVAGVLTAADKAKLDGVAAGATANANTDSLAEGSTNKYFTETRVLATLMAGFTLIAGGTVSAADSMLAAVGKLQKQINDLFSGKQDTLVSGTNIKTVNGSTLLGSGDLVVSGGASLPVVQTFTGPKTLALADINTYNVSQDATAQTVTLPTQATVSWTADAEIHIERGAAGAVSVVGAAGVQINGAVAGTFTLGAQYSVVTLKRKEANLWTLFGNAT